MFSLVVWHIAFRELNAKKVLQKSINDVIWTFCHLFTGYIRVVLSEYEIKYKEINIWYL